MAEWQPKTAWERRKQLGMSGFGMVWRTPGRIPVSALDGKTHRTGIQTGVEPPVQTLVVHNHPITGVSVQYWGPTGGGTPGQTHCFAGLLLTWTTGGGTPGGNPVNVGVVQRPIKRGFNRYFKALKWFA